MNLTAPAAVAALETAFLDMLRSESGGFGAFESEARPVALSCCAEAMPCALEERDREHAASRLAGLREHSRRPRALVTMCGDVCFRRTVLVDCAGLTRYPLNEELDLPAGDHLSPSVRSFLVTCGADVPFARTAELMAIAGGPSVSATTVMDSVRSVGEAMAGIERARARNLFRDGVAPGADSAAEEVLVEADGAWVRMRDGSMAEVKAMSAYAGKEDGRRLEPARLGYVGEAPGDFWEQAVAQVKAGTAASGAEGGSSPTCGGTLPRSGAARRWASWRPSSSTCTRCAWARSRARGRPPAPTRWRGCAAGSGRGSRCLPAPASRSGLRDAGSGGSASSRSTLPGRREGA